MDFDKAIELFDLSGFASDRTKNCDLKCSDIPSSLKLKEECCLGIDEAGRGPVLGPMVYTAFVCLAEQQHILKELGVDDSKALKKDKRIEIMKKVFHADIAWFTTIISPQYISNCMLRLDKYNLNEISHETAISLIHRALSSGINVTKVFVDTVGPPDKYRDKLEREFPQLQIKVESKADATYPVVGAASICAKIIRDDCIEGWVCTEPGLSIAPETFGSGYPSDPTTKQFVRDNIDPLFGHCSFVRHSWSTAQEVVQSRCAAKVRWRYEEDTGDKKAQKITQFFASPTSDHRRRTSQRAPFLRDRRIRRVDRLFSAPA